MKLTAAMLERVDQYDWDGSKRICDDAIELAEALLSERDQEWTRALGITDKVLNPEKCAKWLEADRVARARNVADARQRRGPMHY